MGLALGFTDDEAAIVEAGTVLLEPVGDETFVVGGKEVAGVSVGGSHCDFLLHLRAGNGMDWDEMNCSEERIEEK